MTKLFDHPQVAPLRPDVHFPVDGTLIDACSPNKSLRPEDGGDDTESRGRRSTPQSTRKSDANTRHAQ